MTKILTGKVALVTGGSRGIGAAIARKLAGEGADVTLTYVNGKEKAEAVAAELTAAGGKARAVRADSADPQAVAAVVRETAKASGRLDILVNSAGVLVNGSIDDAARDPQAFARQQAINVGGIVAAVAEAAKTMTAGGRIISIGSVLGARTPVAGVADYSATKAAVAAYTKGWARELGPKGITVNTVQPGPIDTDMNPDEGEFAGALKAGTALGRYGKVEEVAAAVAFLASDGASYITGTTLDVDGGYNA